MTKPSYMDKKEGSEELWDLYCLKCGEYLCTYKSRGIITKKAIIHPHNDLDRIKSKENPDSEAPRRIM